MSKDLILSKYAKQLAIDPFKSIFGFDKPYRDFAYPKVAKFYPGILRDGYVKTKKKSVYILWPLTDSHYFQITQELLDANPNVLSKFPWPIKKVFFDSGMQIWVCKRLV